MKIRWATIAGLVVCAGANLTTEAKSNAWSHSPGKGSLWLNGERVYGAVNSHNVYETWLGNYPKFGLYVPGTMCVPERTLYVDVIRAGGPKTNFRAMTAETPCGKG